MSRFDDYGSEASSGRLTESEIEKLLRDVPKSPWDQDLRLFIASASMPERPPRDASQMATALAATARASRVGKGRRALRSLTVILTAGAMVIAISGLAIAADTAIPGDDLYELDRAFETVGIGVGGIDERIAEFDLLISRGEEQLAFSMLADVIEMGDGQDVVVAQQHLALAATKADVSAQSAQEKVSSLQEFIDENRGPGIGLDGKAFGQCVSTIARTSSQTGCDQQPSETTSSTDRSNHEPDTSDQTGRKDGKADASDSAGPKKDNPKVSGDSANKETGTPSSPSQDDNPAENGSSGKSGRSANTSEQQKPSKQGG